MRAILLLCLTLYGLGLHAQDFQLIPYKVKDGMPTDVVKAVAADSLGFIWLATDEGLVKFDGTRFTAHKGALRSQYAKAFLKTRAGKLLLIGDLDLIEINSRVDTATFTTIREGTRNPTDSSLWYPKSMYEDHTGALWVGEPQSVVCIQGKAMQRFPFGKEDETPEFLRSFAFFEDMQHTLYCVSYFGRVYQFDHQTRAFTRIPVSFPSDIKQIKVIGQTVWIASRSGVFRALLHPTGGFSAPAVAFAIEAASTILPLGHNRLFLGTSNHDQYLADLTHQTFSRLPYEIRDVNTAFLSKSNDLWLACSEGMMLLQENLFWQIPDPEQIRFIESIAEDSATETIYYASILNLYSAKMVNGRLNAPKTFLSVSRGYFQALAFNANGLWVSNQFSLILLKDEKIFKKWDFHNFGRFIFDVFADSRGNIWLSQDGNRKALCINSDMEVQRISVPMKPENNLNVIREDATGILAASMGKDSYLFHKQHGDSVFHNISVLVNFPTQGDFSITDMALNGGAIWLASTEGLLKYDYKTIERVDLGNLNTDLKVKTVESLQEGEILLGNSLGMIRYQPATGEWWLYDEGCGLPSNTISNRGIFVGSHNRVWLGTSRGLSYSGASIVVNEKSTQPLFIQAIVNGKTQPPPFGNHSRQRLPLRIPYGAFLNLVISANTYPTSKVHIEYRFAGKDTVWHSLKGDQLAISDLSAGDYTVEIRARKTGGYNWSNASSLSFVVDRPYWLQSWFIVLAVALLMFVGISSYQLSKIINRKRRIQLENLLQEIQERNTEIQQQSAALASSHETIVQLNTDLERRVAEKSRDLLRTNEELSKNNSDLLQFSYSVSHNLRGPVARLLGLSGLMGATTHSADLQKMAIMVQTSSTELDAVLRDLTHIIDMRNSVSHLREKVFLQEEWNRSRSMLQEQLHPDYEIRLDISQAPYVYTVRALLQSILYNLLSNALKYQSPDRPLVIHLRTRREGKNTLVEVQDNGLGIDLQAQGDNVFKLYKRFHAHTPGKGLGLYLVKLQVELLNGSIAVESAVNVGTTFCVTLPTPEAVEQQIFLDSPAVQLSYDATHNVAVICWFKEITPEIHAQTFQTVLKTMRQFSAPGWLIDFRTLHQLPDCEWVWHSTEILSEATMSGLRRIATVSSPQGDSFARMGRKAAAFDLELQNFAELEAALAWLGGVA